MSICPSIYCKLFINLLNNSFIFFVQKQKYDEDILASDEEDTNTDHYLERMKQEGKDRFSGDEDDDSDSSGWIIN